MTRKVMKIADVETWKGSIYNPNGDVTVAELFVPPRRLEPFCQPGDSGSLVVDGEGHLVGLLWSLADDDTIVTDIRVVFESIREKMELKADTVFGVPTKF
ncbi:hypothetical protein M406DRAFT_324210 [Cryphonectria parasitica EP155]|uniref:Uncharacterized protein n=1 Tax=Cryphonectria parasitica (strain ATCC 38755 / EP155) TaxID=660469 RepID=A0A9P4XVP7_CRYP1|nr:uncharacterized protein M406DRAFT_324210 [Cryphonectria parasitica EP155]KAF3761667.1 hypothetical protein M406DRAFT_324210 [Cryphonectria parasitica EP155]